MKNLYLILIPVLLFFTSIFANAQTWEELTAKPESYYKLGYYRNALKADKNLSKIIVKKYGSNDLYEGWKAAHEAKVLEALGRYDEIDPKLSVVQGILKNYKESNPTEAYLGLSKVADAYLEYGDYIRCQKYLDTLLIEMRDKNVSDEKVLKEIQFQYATIFVETGMFLKADSIMPGLADYWKAQSESITKQKHTDNYNQDKYAQTIILSDRSSSLRGNYDQAYQSMQDHEKEIAKLVGKKSLTFSYFLAAMAQNRLDNDLKKDALKIYEKALSNTNSGFTFQRAYSKASKVYLKIFNDYIIQSMGQRREKFVREDIVFYNKIMYAFYNGKNVFQLKADLLDAYQAMHLNAYNKAERILQKSIEKSDENNILPQNHPLTLEINEKLFEIHSYKSTDVEAAEKDLNSIVTIREALKGAESPYHYLDKIKQAVFYLNNTDKLNEARKVLENNPQSVIFRSFSETHKAYVPVLNYLSEYYDIIEKYDSSLIKINEALTILEKKYGLKSSKYGSELSLLAEIQIKKGNYKNAEENIKASMDIFQKPVVSRVVSYVKDKKTIPTSLKTLKEAISFGSLEYSDALSTTARLYGIMGLYDEAESMLKRSTRINRRLKVDISENAKSIEELAFLYVRIGEYAKTESLLSALISKKEAKYGLNSQTLINPLNQFANVKLITGDYGLAEKSARRAANITKSIFGEQTIRYSESTDLLAQIYLTIGDYDKAEENINQTIDIQKNQLGSKHIKLANSLTTLGLIKFYQSEKNASLADSLFQEGLGIITATFDNQHPLYAQAIKNIAFIYIEINSLDEALEYLNEADAIWKTKLGTYNANSADIALLKGDIFSLQQDFTQAEAQYLSARDIYAKVFSKEHPSYVKTLSRQGQMYYISGNLADANKTINQAMDVNLKFLENYFPSLSENEKAKFWNLMKEDFEFFNTLAVTQADQNPELLSKMYKFTLATKAILLNSSIKVRERILNSTDEDLKLKYKEWIDEKEFLTTALSMSDDQLKKEGIKIKDVIKEIEDLEKELSESSELFKGSENTKPFEWTDVQKALKADQAALEIIRFRYFSDDFTDSVLYAALIVKPSTKKNPELVLLSNGNELENKFLKYYRNAIRNERDDKYTYPNFWEPIEKVLGEYKNVFISPDGAYNQMNLESALKEDGSFVIDEYNLMMLSNTKDLAANFKEQERNAKDKNYVAPEVTNSIVLIGNPAFYENVALGKISEEDAQRSVREGSYVENLPGTQVEIQEIKKLYESNGWSSYVFTEIKATEAEVKKVVSPRIFHIATHGFFTASTVKNTQSATSSAAQNPLLRSALLLEGAGDILAKSSTNFNSQDGILTAAEAMNLNFDNTDLVILSACETGLGDLQIGEGVFGLQRAFLVAGAKGIVMSLFRVSDEVTQQLMIGLHQRFLNGATKREAFREAKLDIKTKYPSPKYWGVFNMIGLE